MSGEIRISAEHIQKHSVELEKDVVPMVDKALTTLNGGTIEGGDFSITGTAASMAYPGALQFGFRDLQTHKQMIQALARGVAANGKTWQGSEDASTLKKV